MLKMKLMFILFGLLVFAQSGLSRPNTSKDDNEDIQNDENYDDYDDDYNEDEDDNKAVTPEIRSRPLRLRGNPGDSVYLPCDNNADQFVVTWKKNVDLIFQNSIKIGAANQDERYSIFPNKTVKITNLSADDAGNYECSIIMDKNEIINIVHRLEVSTPAKIIKITPSENDNKVQVGKMLVLTCEATGIPQPKIIWSKSGNRLRTTEETYNGASVTFERVQKDNAGTYQCLADNGIGKPDSAATDIVVLYPPQIKIEKTIVNTAEGYESLLTCIVHALPKAKVSWEKDSVSLQSDKKINIINEGNKHILKIIETKKSDFGNYSCIAKNDIGYLEKTVILSGKPAPADFIKAIVSPNGDEANVTFKVESNSPIVEYQLEYRKKGQHEKWRAENPKVNNPDGNVYTVTHLLKELDADVYEIKLRARNTYGWSSFSHHKTFDTQQRITEEESLPVSENREDTTQTESDISNIQFFTEWKTLEDFNYFETTEISIDKNTEFSVNTNYEEVMNIEVQQENYNNVKEEIEEGIVGDSSSATRIVSSLLFVIVLNMYNIFI